MQVVTGGSQPAGETASPSFQKQASERGLALLIVIFIVALASIVVINLTYSTYLGSRISVTAERSVQAEYILKSTVNFARTLIKMDDTDEDSLKDFWGKFSNGLDLPPDMLGINVPNIRIQLEIRPEGSKMNIKSLVPRTLNGQPDTKWRDVLERLCLKLGFDADQEQQASGSYEGRNFTVKEMIGNLIDYMDSDKEPYEADGFKGIENDSSGFPNTQISRLAELAAVPGFTPARVQMLSPFLTTRDNLRININLAPKLLLSSLHPDVADAQVESIIQYRNSEEGPFQNISKLRDFVTDDSAFNEISSLLTERSNWFQVLAKVDYGTSTYFLRSYLSKTGKNQLPIIQSIELF